MPPPAKHIKKTPVVVASAFWVAPVGVALLPATLWIDGESSKLDLLIAKAYNIAGLPQEWRNDARHLRIMVIVIRAFLEELLQQLGRDEITARDVLWEIKRLFRLANHRAIRAVLQTKLRRMVPVAEFRRCQHPQIVKFCGQSLEGYLEGGE